jgi:hypothetical protein
MFKRVVGRYFGHNRLLAKGAGSSVHTGMFAAVVRKKLGLKTASHMDGLFGSDRPRCAQWKSD